MIAEILVFIVSVLVAYCIYSYKQLERHIRDKGVKYLPGVPIFGNVFKSTFQLQHILDDLNDVYKAHPDERYVCYFEGTLPVIMIRDPELMKSITVKDFDHWVDHRLFFGNDPLFGESLFSMRGEEWRDMRSTLSPAFTGSKMRLMLPFMAEISKYIVQYLTDNQNEVIDVDDLIRRYTNDVIASAAFGLQVNSVKDRNNKFYTLGQQLFEFTMIQKFKMFIIGQFPYIAKKLNIQIFEKSLHKFFSEIVTNTMEYREKNNVERPDMIQLLMEATKGTLKAESNAVEENIGFAAVDEALKPSTTNRQWTVDKLVGQVFLFFAAGFETSATSLVLTIHEMALNEDVQEKLYQELRSFKESHKDLSYDNLSKLKYLDCVVNEILRKWSPAIALDRQCVKPYELPPPREGGKPYKVKPGDIIYNVVNSVHMDPKHHPDPHKYDPERFSDENKHMIKPFTFMPFGMGPRNCIGSRFALMELKVFIYYLMVHFNISKNERTSDPIVLLNGTFNLKARGGTWVNFTKRD